jgi:hypothetical protein
MMKFLSGLPLKYDRGRRLSRVGFLMLFLEADSWRTRSVRERAGQGTQSDFGGVEFIRRSGTLCDSGALLEDTNDGRGQRVS